MGFQVINTVVKDNISAVMFDVAPVGGPVEKRENHNMYQHHNSPYCPIYVRLHTPCRNLSLDKDLLRR